MMSFCLSDVLFSASVHDVLAFLHTTEPFTCICHVCGIVLFSTNLPQLHYWLLWRGRCCQDRMLLLHLAVQCIEQRPVESFQSPGSHCKHLNDYTIVIKHSLKTYITFEMFTITYSSFLYNRNSSK